MLASRPRDAESLTPKAEPRHPGVASFGKNGVTGLGTRRRTAYGVALPGRPGVDHPLLTVFCFSSHSNTFSSVIERSISGMRPAFCSAA